MPNLEDLILSATARTSYVPLKPKALARKLNVPAPSYPDFRRALRALLRDGRVEVGKNHTVRPAPPHGTITGTYRRTGTGVGYVRPHPIEGRTGPEVRVHEDGALDAATGDTVLVRITRKPNRPDMNPAGRVVRVLERATRNFVGTYFERDGDG